jgi:serine/threonine-protein kinase HipA
MRLDFTQEAEARFGAGSPVLSTSMRVDAEQRPRGDTVRAFFTGLLPEGPARDTISREFGVELGDYYGLLAAIGRDCAGAVVVQPEGSAIPGEAGHVDVLADHDLERLVTKLTERPLGADPDEDIRVSLTGVQEKLLLAKTAAGEWGRPAAGAPSTHILKPQDMRLAGYATAEDFCLRLARRLDLTNVESETMEVNGRPMIVVSRYDRMIGRDGTVERVHQEDACQALGVDVISGGDKYQSRGGPSLERFARMLSDVAPAHEREKLLALTVLNVAVGNADAHAKNLSILHPPDQSIRLAPAYDVTPTTFYRGVPTSQGPRDLSDQLGMWINGRRSIHTITTDDLIAEGLTWDMSHEAASEVVHGTLVAIAEHAGGAASEARLPAAILDYVASRTAALRAGRRAGAKQ